MFRNKMCTADILLRELELIYKALHKHTLIKSNFIRHIPIYRFQSHPVGRFPSRQASWRGCIVHFRDGNMCQLVSFLFWKDGSRHDGCIRVDVILVCRAGMRRGCLRTGIATIVSTCLGRVRWCSLCVDSISDSRPVSELCAVGSSS